jgi:FkbM family methyltransferase
VHFPPRSHIFEMVCAEGIYEHETLNIILSLVEPDTTYFDIGANIGLLSVPVLAERPFVKVVSVEASPDTLHFLKKTHAVAPRREDWTIIDAAVGSENNETEFWFGGGAIGAFDGRRDTGRGGRKRAVRVPLRALDQIWETCGCPPVSVVKMDIEGGEYDALQGAKSIIAREKPVFVVEWTDLNLRAYGIPSGKILQLCEEIDYGLYASPSLSPVPTPLILKMTMCRTETFILAPRGDKLQPVASAKSTVWESGASIATQSLSQRAEGKRASC